MTGELAGRPGFLSDTRRRARLRPAPGLVGQLDPQYAQAREAQALIANKAPEWRSSHRIRARN